MDLLVRWPATASGVAAVEVEPALGSLVSEAIVVSGPAEVEANPVLVPVLLGANAGCLNAIGFVGELCAVEFLVGIFVLDTSLQLANIRNSITNKKTSMLGYIDVD